MPAPKILILRAPGTNCDRETDFAFSCAGGVTECVHVNALLENPRQLIDYQILCIPGGFSYGDDISAGRILACQIRHHLADTISEFRDAGKLVLGICNGFQVLIKSGVLVTDCAATLTWNDKGRFEDRWVRTAVDGERCVFLRGIESMYLPIAHAEGKFVARDGDTLGELDQAGQLALRYADENSQYSTSLDFPNNPNGSQANVAGMCDETGRVLGMMPHPERHLDPTHHPQWTRMDSHEQGDGLRLFENAIRYFD
ncbi:MAG: phosphoribosylformylglycinamidine synthase I [Pirellulaceae bacterium]|nr:phosphoribosylformylglycinamidine synthase I [Pirellulaceae bacterium]|tara:strand:+ start:477 stop:1244 length:768 start_codon:yes stop_codon:yes gene_type:complete